MTSLIKDIRTKSFLENFAFTITADLEMYFLSTQYAFYPTSSLCVMYEEAHVQYRKTDGRTDHYRAPVLFITFCLCSLRILLQKLYISLLTLMVSQSKQQRKSQFMLMSSFSKISFIKDIFTINIYIFCHHAWKYEYFRITLQSQNKTKIAIN